MIVELNKTPLAGATNSHQRLDHRKGYLPMTVAAILQQSASAVNPQAIPPSIIEGREAEVWFTPEGNAYVALKLLMGRWYPMMLVRSKPARKGAK